DEITKYVIPCECRDVRPVIDITAYYRFIALRAVVIENGIQKSRRLAVSGEIKCVRAFFTSPAEIRAALRWRHTVHLFERALADVTDPKIPRCVIHGETEGVTQSVQPDLVCGSGLRDEGIVRGDTVGPSAVHSNAQNFAEPLGGFLPIPVHAVHIAGAPATAKADIQEAVVSKC